MTDKQNKPTRSLAELNTRRQVCLGIISYLTREAKGDPRLPGALKEYNRQLKSIKSQIAELANTPAPVIVGLKTAVLDLRIRK